MRARLSELRRRLNEILLVAAILGVVALLLSQADGELIRVDLPGRQFLLFKCAPAALGFLHGVLRARAVLLVPVPALLALTLALIAAGALHPLIWTLVVLPLPYLALGWLAGTVLRRHVLDRVA